MNRPFYVRYFAKMDGVIWWSKKLIRFTKKEKIKQKVRKQTKTNKNKQKNPKQNKLINVVISGCLTILSGNTICSCYLWVWTSTETV